MTGSGVFFAVDEYRGAGCAGGGAEREAQCTRGIINPVFDIAGDIYRNIVARSRYRHGVSHPANCGLGGLGHRGFAPRTGHGANVDRTGAADSIYLQEQGRFGHAAAGRASGQ